MSLILLTAIFLCIPLFAYGEAMAESGTDDSVRLAPVEISVTRAQRNWNETAAAVSVIDFTEQAGGIGATLGDAFTLIPGVVSNGSGQLVAEQPNIRGLSGDRVLIRLDGARKNFSNVHRGRFFVDTEFLQRAEVLRGAGSVYYGSGAIGGVVDLTTKSATDFLRPGERFGSTLKYVYDGNDDRRRFYTHSYGLIGDTADVLLSFGLQKSHDYTDGDNRRVTASSDDLFNGLFKSTIVLPQEHELKISAQRWRDDSDSYTTPGICNPELVDSSCDVPVFTIDSIIPVQRRTTEDTISLAHAYKRGTLLDLDNRVYFSRTEVKENRADAREERVDTRAIRGLGFELGNKARFNAFKGEHVLRKGFDFYRETQKGRRQGGSNPIPYPSAEQTIWGLYVNNDMAWLEDRLHGSVAVRFDSYSQDARSAGLKDNSDTNVSPSASVLYRLGNGISPYALYAEGFRAPALTELYSDGIHFPAVEVPVRIPIIDMGRPVLDRMGRPTFRTVNIPILPENRFVVNENLKPEKVRSFEGGITFDRKGIGNLPGRVYGRALYFYSRYDDFIEQTIVDSQPAIMVEGRVVRPAVQGTTMYRNVADAVIQGIEMQLAYREPDWGIELNATRLRGEDKVSKKPLNGIAADQLVFSVDYALLPDMLRTGWRSTFAAAQNRVVEANLSPRDPRTFASRSEGEQNLVNASSFTGLYPSPGYAVHDLFFELTLGKKAKQGRRADSIFFVRVENLFAKTYRPHTSNFYARGLNLRLGIEQSF